MIRIEHREIFRPNGLIDDFVLFGSPSDYVALAGLVQAAIHSGRPETLHTQSWMRLEIQAVSDRCDLFTSLQNQEDTYPSREEWQQRNVLRVIGSAAVLEQLHLFLLDLSGRGDGYSYISQYSEALGYSSESPEWRLHVQHD